MKRAWIGLAAIALSSGCGDDKDETPAPIESALDYRVIVHGRLAAPGGTASEANRSAHDRAAKSTKSLALASDMKTHLAYTALQDPQDYAAIEVWTDLAKLRAYYDDPSVKAEWAALFEGAPTVEIWRHPKDWVQWGEVTKPGQGKPPTFFFHLRNRLKNADEEQNRVTHNRVAGGDSQQHAIRNSDIGHSAHLNVDDKQELLFIDFWGDLAGANEFFTDPVTMAGGAELFATPFTVTLYAPTDWYQWTKDVEESGPIDGTWSVQSFECNGVAQPIASLTVQIFNTQGSFVIGVPMTCTATITEQYSYPSEGSLLITPTANNCAPSADACAPAFGGATSCPTPPPVEFAYELSDGTLTFSRTSVGPQVDSCAAGETVRYVMQRK